MRGWADAGRKTGTGRPTKLGGPPAATPPPPPLFCLQRVPASVTRCLGCAERRGSHQQGGDARVQQWARPLPHLCYLEEVAARARVGECVEVSIPLKVFQLDLVVKHDEKGGGRGCPPPTKREGKEEWRATAGSKQTKEKRRSGARDAAVPPPSRPSCLAPVSVRGSTPAAEAATGCAGRATHQKKKKKKS